MRRLALIVALLTLIASPEIPLARGFVLPATRVEDVIYGRKFGTALTLDVFTPRENAKGIGVIFVVSGGWFSAHEVISEKLVEPLVTRGYTVFAVVHGSQPRFTIPEILTDMHRAVRFIRHHAADYRIDPDRIGIYGGSAGGHLSLMQGVASTEGDPKAKDPVDRVSSRVQAVACLYPPTDFLNYGRPGENALGRGILENFQAPFDFHELDRTRNRFVPITDEEKVLAIGRDISPVNHVTADDPPTLIIHGDADKLVPIQQAELFLARLKGASVEGELIVKRGAAHGWPEIEKDVSRFADWFDAHLARDETKQTARPARSRKSDLPPRKVLVATTIHGPWNQPDSLPDRIDRLEDLVNAMADRAKQTHPGRGLDLVILPEEALSAGQGPPSKRSLPLEGAVRDAFSALARAHNSYLILPMDLIETTSDGTTYANAAVLFDRKGEVAGIYRKVNPVAGLGTDELEGGVTPGTKYPVFDCDFGKLGIQICWDIQFADGWKALKDAGAEIVAWPTASPATIQPATRAAMNRYFVVSSTWREDATVFEPTGMIAAQIEEPEKFLIHELDLSHAILGWSPPLQDGKAFRDRFGDKAGFHYSRREDQGLFWSNDPSTPIGSMIRELGLEELDDQIARDQRLLDAARSKLDH